MSAYQVHPIRVERFDHTHYVKLSGVGPCNWAQPPCWPCDEDTLREHAAGYASEAFIRSCLIAAGVNR